MFRPSGRVPIVRTRAPRRPQTRGAPGRGGGAALLGGGRARGGGAPPPGGAPGGGGERPRHERGLEEGPRQACVASDDEPHAVRSVFEQERRDELTPDPEREVGSERVLVGDAANPVGAEQACHRAAPSRRRPPIGSSDLISTVTCTLRWSVRYTDSGSASPTLCDTVSRRPAISTGTVSTVVRPSIVERGPLTCTVAGSTVTRWIA